MKGWGRMENQKVKQWAEEVVQEEIRKGDLVRSKDVLTMLPELIDTVYIDKKGMRGSIEECLTSRNPLNSLLNLFGVQLIKKEKAINKFLGSSIDVDSVAVKIDESNVKHWLTLDRAEFKGVIEKISQKLYELETQANESYDEEKRRGDELFSKYEKLAREYNELKYSAETSDKLVAERIQYILSLEGQNDSRENKQFVELLKDMSIDVYWDCNNAPMTDAAMFTEYSIDDDSMVSTKPCLVKDGAIFVKGIRFIKK